MTHEALAAEFDARRPHLRGVAYRMLGSLGEADDAVQEAWLRLARSEAVAVANLGGWLTTVVARVCFDALRSRKARREEPADDAPEPRGKDPGTDLVLADSVGLALLAVLDTLAPAERVAYVLHDLLDVPFDEIAPIVGRTPAAATQLASRVRRRVHGAAASEGDFTRNQEIVDAFLAASRAGDLDALLAVLDPQVVLRADPATVAAGAPKELRGADTVAESFKGRARAALPALVDGAPGAVWAPGGRPRVVFGFKAAHGKIVEIRMLADPERLRQLDLVLLKHGVATRRLS